MDDLFHENSQSDMDDNGGGSILRNLHFDVVMFIILKATGYSHWWKTPVKK